MKGYLWRALSFPNPARTLENDDIYRSTQAFGHDRTHGPRWRGIALLAYFEQVLISTWAPGDMVVMDNL